MLEKTLVFIRIWSTCLCMVIWTGALSCAQEPLSQLVLLKRPASYDKDTPESEKNHLYYARIVNATSDSKLSSFLEDVSRHKMSSLRIERTTLTAEQARKLERMATDQFELSISNCELNEEVAKSLGRLPIHTLTLRQMRMSDQVLSELLKGKTLGRVAAAEIRGCTAEGWRALSNRASLQLELLDCDFDDQALLHLSSSKLYRLKLTNTLLTGATLGALKSQSACMRELSLRGCPVTDQALQNLHEFANLQHLDLSGSLVTDAGLRNFVVKPELNMIIVANTKVTQACGLDLSRKYQDDEKVLFVSFHNDPRWPPYGGYCMRGEFHLYRY